MDKKYVGEDSLSNIFTKIKSYIKNKIDPTLDDVSTNAVQNQAVTKELNKKLNSNLKGANNGVAELDASGKVPASQLPSYVDDVVECYYDSDTEKMYENKDVTDPEHPIYSGEIKPESGKIYIDKDGNDSYRWTGSMYASVGSANALTLGETAQTAYRGDRGKTAYDDSQTNKTNIGTMTNLITEETSTLVGAINEVKTEVGDKVDKVTGKGLSANDYTNTDKAEVAKVADKQNKDLSSAITVDGTSKTTVEDAVTALATLANYNKTNKLDQISIADTFDATATYEIDDFVIYNTKLYKATAQHTGEWDANDFAESQVMDEIVAAMVSSYSSLLDKPQLAGIVWEGNKTYSQMGIQQSETGKGLSTNDYDDAAKAIVDGVTAALADKQPKTLETAVTIEGGSKTTVQQVADAVATHTGRSVTDNTGAHGLKVTAVSEDEDAIYYKSGNDWKQIQLGSVTQLAEMPTAAAKYVGKIYQYVGTTTEDYKKGYFYECVNSAGVYAWQAVRVQSGGGQTIQYDPLPTAEASIVGQLSQYIGATNANYTRGYFYECVAIETEDEQTGETTVTFGWDHVQVQDGEYLSDEDLDEIKSEFHPQGSSVAPQPMRGATTVQDGRAGYVPTPYIKDRNRFLAGDGRWHEIYTGGSGSTVLVKVEDSTYYGKQVTMTDGVDTLTSTFDDSGEAVFTNVTLFGSVVLESVNDEDYSALGSTNLTYFGMYVVGISADYSIINISTTDTDLYGQDVDVYLNGSEIAGTTIGVNGNATVIASELGTYELRAKSGQRFAKATVRVNEFKHIYSTVLKLTTLFAVHYSESDSNPDRCDYPQGYSNSDFTDPFYVDLTTGKPHWGDWTSPLAKFLIPKSCMLKTDGTVDYYLDEDNNKLKLDGTASDNGNLSYNGNAMMEWAQEGKRIYWTLIPDSNGTGWTWVVGDGDYDGLLHPWNHIAYDGSINYHFYLPKYKNSYVYNNKARSMTGYQPSANSTRQNERTYARANNATSDIIWDVFPYADWFFLDMMCVLFSRSLATQLKFGRGFVDYTWNNRNDAKVSGGMDTKGLFYGDSNGGTSGLGVKVFGTEHPWGNGRIGIMGCINASGTIKTKLCYGRADGTTVDDYNFDGNGYMPQGTIGGTSGGYIKNMNITSMGLTPKTISGSDSTYYGDSAWFNNIRTSYALAGGSWYDVSSCGAFYCNLYEDASAAADHIGSALSCKPLATD